MILYLLPLLGQQVYGTFLPREFFRPEIGIDFVDGCYLGSSTFAICRSRDGSLFLTTDGKKAIYLQPSENTQWSLPFKYGADFIVLKHTLVGNPKLDRDGKYRFEYRTLAFSVEEDTLRPFKNIPDLYVLSDSNGSSKNSLAYELLKGRLYSYSVSQEFPKRKAYNLNIPFVGIPVAMSEDLSQGLVATGVLKLFDRNRDNWFEHSKTLQHKNWSFPINFYFEDSRRIRATFRQGGVNPATFKYGVFCFDSRSGTVINDYPGVCALKPIVVVKVDPKTANIMGG